MHTYILGISAFYHDSAACLLKDNKLIAAAQEERFTRKKHDPSFPEKAIQFCLESNNITIDDIQLICFYEKPFQKFDRIIDTYARNSPIGFKSFKKAIKSWTSEKLWIPNIIEKKLNYSGEIIFTEHHEAHAASAFFSSPFKEAAILIIDGVGEKATISIFKGIDNNITPVCEQRFPHSIGLLYSAFTYYCGFKVNSGEYKLMGLAPYGKPIYKDLIFQHFVSIDEASVITLNMKHFNFEAGLKMISPSFETILGEKRRTPESEMTLFYKDIASSIQSVLEEIVVQLAKQAKKLTNTENLCLAGGVALNCKANQEIEATNIFKNIWVQPASGDSGGALGASYIGAFHYLKNNRLYPDNTLNNHIYLGNSYSEEEITHVLDQNKINYKKYPTKELITQTANLLDNKAIVGWFQGNMEYGPRSLGNRSILASPKFKDMKSHINLKIKKREGFRPFAPVVLQEKASEWFDINLDSKYMLFTCYTKQDSRIPACSHVNGTSRVQVLEKKENSLLYDLISAFEKQSGIPILINTSFNERGEPIVCAIEDAIHCFLNTEMDYLILNNCLISKQDNTNIHLPKIKTYELD